MLKISVTHTRAQCRVILEGRLVAPWDAELRTACAGVKGELKGRVLVIDLENVTAISHEGERVLLQLMNDDAKFRCRGVFTKHVLRQLARQIKKDPNDLIETVRPSVREQKKEK